VINGHFITIHKVSDTEITYFNGIDEVVENANTFFQKWKGVILIAEKRENSGEKNYFANYRKEFLKRMTMPIVFFIGLLIILSLAIIDLVYKIDSFSGVLSLSLLMMVKWLGIATTTILLWYEIDKKNGFIQKICTGLANTNCSAVLSSKDAKLFGIISWSEIGFFYYSFGFLCLLFYPNMTWLIILINLCGLPYIFYSIYYQWKIAKQWCILCLTVQFLLFSEFIINLFSGNIKHLESVVVSNNIYTLPGLLSIILLTTGLWYLIKPLFKAKVKLQIILRDLNRIKFNDEIFFPLLQKQKFIGEIDPKLGIILGNPEGEHTIIKVCNPYCGPCGKAHPEIESLLSECNNLKVQILFTATAKDDDFQSPPVMHFLAIAENNNAKSITEALDIWYNAEHKDYQIFSELYPISSNLLKVQKLKIEAMSKWCKEVDIEFTPTFFYNGYQLPSQYSLIDLAYFIQE